MILKNRIFQWWSAVFFLVALVLVIYLPTVQYGFLVWDDNINISDNPYILKYNWRHFWEHIYYGMYIPVTYTVWDLIFYFEKSPWAFRVLNICLHLGNTFLVFSLINTYLRKISYENIAIAFCGAAIFAAHPMQVEAVAWISGGRDLLATFFALGALLVLAKNESLYSYLGAFLLFTLGMLSKPSIATFPIAAGWLSIVILNRSLHKTILWTLACLVIPLVITIYSYSEQSTVIYTTLPFWGRIIVAIDSIGFYLLKFIFPLVLSADYGRKIGDVFNEFSSNWAYLFIGSLFIAILGWLIKRNKVLSTPILGFLIALLPASGIVGFSFQEYSTVADRYLYLPIFFLVLCLSFWLSKESVKIRYFWVPIILVAAVLSVNRIRVWQSNESLFSDMISFNSSSHPGLMGLGMVSLFEGKSLEALKYFEVAERNKPGDLAALDGILLANSRMGRSDEILRIERNIITEDFNLMMELRPRQASNIFTSIGLAYFQKERFLNAFYYFCYAHLLNPFNPAYEENAEIGSEKVLLRCPEKLDLNLLIKNR